MRQKRNEKRNVDDILNEESRLTQVLFSFAKYRLAVKRSRPGGNGTTRREQSALRRRSPEPAGWSPGPSVTGLTKTLPAKIIGFRRNEPDQEKQPGTAEIKRETNGPVCPELRSLSRDRTDTL